MIKYAIFDLDGTLLSTLDSILHHLNRALGANGISEITLTQCGEFIGNGARKLVERAAGAGGVCDEGIIQRVLSEYNEAYNTDPLPYTYPYDGICELVDGLCARGVSLGVVTNKPEPTAKQLVEYFFPGKFAFVRGGRAGAVLKPDPADSTDALSTLGGSPAECAFIGDTPVDIKTGKNMGAAISIGVLWGFRTFEDLERAGADAIVSDPREILLVVDGYGAG